MKRPEKVKNIMKKIILLSILVIMPIHVLLSSRGGKSNDLTKQTVHLAVEDSIKLAADLYLPDGPGPFPCILVRSPYSKDGIGEFGEKYVRLFLSHGWAVIIQDTRGKFESEGIYHPFKHERPDGLATIKWVRSQSWCNGKVAGWGGSYVGYTQWAIADQLDVITPTVTSANMYELIYPAGIYSLATAFNWGLPNGARTYNTVNPEKMEDSYFILPLSVADDSTIKQIDFLDDWLAHPHEDAYWGAMNHRSVVTCPVYTIAGWYDIFLMSQIRDFESMGPYRHPESRLIIGPYAHGKIAIETDFGEHGELSLHDDEMMSFIKRHLTDDAGKTEESDPRKPYTFFIMHRNEWVDYDHWPPEKSISTPYYLNSNGEITQHPDDTEKIIKYTYDPVDPFPSIGGTYLGVGVGPAYQNPNTERMDQIVFESEPLEKPLVLLGPVDATIYAGTDAPSTDFFVSLQEVREDGKIINIQEGGQTIYSDETGSPRPLRLDISVWATGYQIEAGHKIRVVITSSLFPRYNRNLNSGEPVIKAQNPRIAHQKVYFGKKYPSQVRLPVLDID